MPYVVGVVLFGEMRRDRERVGFLAAEPRVGETQGESFVIGAVGLGRYRQALVLPHRIGAPCTLFEEVFDRKVVERDADRTYERAGAPAARDVELVGSLLLERPVDVDKPVGYRFDVGHDRLGVEMPHRTERADGLHQQRAVVEFAREGAQLAADDFVVDALVARDAHLVDLELLALEYLDLDVDRVRADDRLGGFDLRHQVTVVLVERRDGHRLGVGFLADAQSFVHRLFVVGVALAHAEHLLQVVGFVDRVAHPRYVADVIFVAFRDFEVDAQPLVVDRVDRIAHDRSVTVTARVVEVDQEVFVLFVIIFVELRPAENVDALLVGLLEGTAQALVLELFVAREIDLADLDLVLAVDEERDVHHLRAQRVVGDAHVHLRIAEGFFRPVGLDELFVLVDDIIR